MSRILHEYTYIFPIERAQKIHVTHVKECYNFKEYSCCSCQYIAGVTVQDVSRNY